METAEFRNLREPKVASIDGLLHRRKRRSEIQRPDLTLVETVAELRKRRIKTSRSSLWRFLDRHNITLKKSAASSRTAASRCGASAPPLDREQGMLDPARLVFIDETAVSTNMVRLRGRAPRGVRVIGAVPLGRWETITFVAALRHNKMVAPMVVEGAMTGEMFLAYVENCLVPTLRRNDIVVMDNCFPVRPRNRQRPALVYWRRG